LGYISEVVRKFVLDHYPHLSDNLTFHLHDWDPSERPYGTGRALYALIRDGVLDVNKPVLTLFTDDLYRRVEYVWDLVRAFNYANKRNSICGGVLVSPEVQLPFGVVEPGTGNFNEKPSLPIPVSAGMYILSPKILHDIRAYIDDDVFNNTEGEVSFEKYILEPCSRTSGIVAVRLVPGDWLPLNDWKNARRAEEFLGICQWVVV
jgi:NDP-sugar pyrophosphorylase family protein